MTAKRGRPLKEDSKDYMLRVRMDKELLSELEECCRAKKKSRSEIVRIGIKEQYARLKK